MDHFVDSMPLESIIDTMVDNVPTDDARKIKNRISASNSRKRKNDELESYRVQIEEHRNREKVLYEEIDRLNSLNDVLWELLKKKSMSKIWT